MLLLTLNKKYVIIIIVNKKRKMNSVVVLRKDKICSHYFYRKLIDITTKIRYNINTVKNRKEDWL